MSDEDIAYLYEDQEPVRAWPDYKLIAGRIEHVRYVCAKSIERDGGFLERAWTDRHWLAQSILNILDGNVDAPDL